MKHTIIYVTQALIDSRKGPRAEDVGYGYEFDEDDVTASSRAVIIRAFEAALPWAVRVRMSAQSIKATDPEQGHRVSYGFTPKVEQMLWEAISSMNVGSTVEPFQFKLMKPSFHSFTVPRDAADAEAGQTTKEPKPQSKPEAVLEYLKSCHATGAIASGISNELGIPGKFVGAILNKLCHRGLVVRAEKPRKSPSGRSVTVYIHAEHGS